MRTATTSSPSTGRTSRPVSEHNFNQHISDGDDVGAYDYGSIMHYERTAFTKNGQETVTPINPANAQIGQRVALSAGDLAAVASMYGAPAPSRSRRTTGRAQAGARPAPRRRQEGPRRRGRRTEAGLRPASRRDQEDPRRHREPEDRGRPAGRRDQEDPRRRHRRPATVRTDRSRPAASRGLSPFLLGTGHHAAIAGGQGDPTGVAAAAALDEASAAVSEARRNVVALQTALTGATSELARAQETYDAVAASLQG